MIPNLFFSFGDFAGDFAGILCLIFSLTATGPLLFVLHLLLVEANLGARLSTGVEECLLAGVPAVL
jgi:hypothetical protein